MQIQTIWAEKVQIKNIKTPFIWFNNTDLATAHNYVNLPIGVIYERRSKIYFHDLLFNFSLFESALRNIHTFH
jgi:hypothetical protein